MIKKTLKTIVVGGVWTVLYLFVTRVLFVSIYGFDYLSPYDWHKINVFWTNGGVIKSGRDYLFLFCLLMLVPVWFVLLKRLLCLNYLNLLLSPFLLFNKLSINKYKAQNKRILLKNIGTSVKVEEEIKLKTATVKPQERNEADKIRSAVSQKLKNEQKLNDN